MESRGKMEESFGLCQRLYPTIVHASEYRISSIGKKKKKNGLLKAKKALRVSSSIFVSFLSLLPIKEVNTRSPTVPRAEHVRAKLPSGWYRITRYTLLRMKEAGDETASERSCQSKLFSRQKLKRLILFQKDTVKTAFRQTQTVCILAYYRCCWTSKR